MNGKEGREEMDALRRVAEAKLEKRPGSGGAQPRDAAELEMLVHELEVH